MYIHVHVYVYVQVLELEDRKGEWGFKALKQMMKILFRKVNFHQSVLYMLILYFVYTSKPVRCLYM